jgi:hypothetical protein
MPDDMPDAEQPETETVARGAGSTRDEAADERDSGRPPSEDDLAKQPEEEMAGWKAASEASKDASDDSRP